MARPGICYDDVKQAARQLLEEGSHPSIQRIRERLGTGSNSTIADHLKRWQQELAETRHTALPPALPEAVLQATTAVWQAAVEQAHTTYQEHRQQADQQVAQAEQARAEALTHLARAQSVSANLEQQLTASQTEIRQLQDQLLLEQERRRTAEAAIAVAEQQVAEAVERTAAVRQEGQERLASLEQLIQQLRTDAQRQQEDANQRLTYERERGEANETRLLRLLDQARTEHTAERQTLNTSLHASQQRETDLRRQWQTLQQEQATLQVALSVADTRQQALIEERDYLRSQRDDFEQQQLQTRLQLETCQGEMKGLERERQTLVQALTLCQQTLAHQPVSPDVAVVKSPDVAVVKKDGKSD